MNCPNCNQNPISLVGFLFKFNPLKLICKSCGAKLEASYLIRAVFIGAIILGFSMGVLDIGFGKVILILVIVVTPLEFVTWKYGRNEMQESIESVEDVLDKK